MAWPSLQAVWALPKAGQEPALLRQVIKSLIGHEEVFNHQWPMVEKAQGFQLGSFPLDAVAPVRMIQAFGYGRHAAQVASESADGQLERPSRVSHSAILHSGPFHSAPTGAWTLRVSAGLVHVVATGRAWVVVVGHRFASA